MGCGKNKAIRVSKTVFSTGQAGAGEIFHVLRRLRENDAANAKISYLMEAGNGKIEVIPAARGTKDGFTYPDAPVAWTGATWLSTNNTWTWGSAYAAPNDDYEQVEFGFLVRNTGAGGTAKESALVTLVIEVRE